MERITLTKIGPYNDDWAIIYLDPSDVYSPGGGRITVITSDYVGSTFFSHVGQPTFKEFIAQCDSHYLIKKLFKFDKWIPVESGKEFIEYLARERMSDIKEYRSTGEVTKKELRTLYEELQGCEFTSTSHLYDILGQDKINTLNTLLGDDWWWDSNPSKLNRAYTYLDSMLTNVIAEFVKLKEETPNDI